MAMLLTFQLSCFHFTETDECKSLTILVGAATYPGCYLLISIALMTLLFVANILKCNVPFGPIGTSYLTLCKVLHQHDCIISTGFNITDECTEILASHSMMLIKCLWS